MAEHTPGPWLNDGYEIIWPVLSNEGSFVKVEDLQLATNSPELLGSLEELLEILEPMEANTVQLGFGPSPRIARARAVIAKARGTDV